jgi:hypothetical protein
MIGVADWDRKLEQAEFFRLRPETKRIRTRLSFERKVALMERAAKEPILLLTLDRKNFRSQAALRRWEDDQHGLWAWSDPAVESNEGNADLLTRWTDALAAIDVLHQGKHHALQNECDAKDIMIASLERQICDLMDQISILQVRLKSQEMTVR